MSRNSYGGFDSFRSCFTNLLLTSSASPQKGLFYFDASFRPVPLEQHFLGIKGKPGSLLSRKNLDNATFQKVSELVANGHQVMVFVHARKETVKAAMSLREMALLEGNSEDFICEDHPHWNLYRQKIGESRNKEMKQLFDGGFGIHHAGMPRSDRNIMEKMFSSKAIKVCEARSNIVPANRPFVRFFVVPQRWHGASTYPHMQVTT
jgi:antiviral helicase SLH1